MQPFTWLRLLNQQPPSPPLTLGGTEPWNPSFCPYFVASLVPLYFQRNWCLRSVHAKLLQACLTLCDHMNCSPPGSSVHGILQARIMGWVAALGIECVSPALQVDSLLSEPPGKPLCPLLEHLYLCFEFYFSITLLTLQKKKSEKANNQDFLFIWLH